MSKILSAFIKGKLDVDKIVLPKLKNRHLYLPADMLDEKTEEKKDTDQPVVVRPAAHTATTFDEAVASEEP